MKNLVIAFALLFNPLAMAEGISLFWQFVAFSGGEFYNPHEMNNGREGVINIVIDRSCQQSACYGKVIISPKENTEQLFKEYSFLKKTTSIYSACKTNVILRKHDESIVSVYHG